MAFAFASFGTIGISLVVTSWVAASEGSIALVGQLFFVGSTTSLIFSIYAGALTDRRERLSVVRWGQALRILAVTVLGVASVGAPALAPWLFVYTLLFSLGTILSAGALDGIIQASVEESRRMRLAVKVSICRQVGIVVGTGIGGILLHYFPIAISVALMATLMAFQMMLINGYFSAQRSTPGTAPRSLIKAWSEGLQSLGANRRLAFTILSVGLFFSVSQMANVLVPGFVQNTLHRGSDVYGLLETSWAVGGGAMLATAVVRTRLLDGTRLELAILIVAGASMILFSTLRSIPALVIVYAMMGGLFALGRAICDGRILILANNNEIGRIRAATSMIVSVFGMAIYISPSVLGVDNAIFYYVAWGVVVSSVGLLMLGVSAVSGRSRREGK